jgi:4Fe-4S ferredoxin
MAIYKLLPNTNGRQCGEATCFSFALKLAASQKRISECAPVLEKQCAGNLAAILAMINNAPAAGGETG